MTLQEIIDRCHHLRIHEERSINDEYFELVIFNNEMTDWYRIFGELFGPPRKPQGVEPTEDDLSLTKASGGIRVNQTLYEKRFEDVTIVAKFWPWGDKVHTTLKMALLT